MQLEYYEEVKRSVYEAICSNAKLRCFKLILFRIHSVLVIIQLLLRVYSSYIGETYDIRILFHRKRFKQCKKGFEASDCFFCFLGSLTENWCSRKVRLSFTWDSQFLRLGFEILSKENFSFA